MNKTFEHLFILFFSFTILFIATKAQENTSPDKALFKIEKIEDQFYLSLNVKNYPLKKIIYEAQKETKLNIFTEVDVAATISLNLEKVPLFEALELVINQGKCRLTQISEHIWWVSQPSLLSMEFSNSDVKKIVNTVATIANINIVYPDNFTGNVTISFKELPYDQVLEAVVKTVGGGFKIYPGRRIFWISQEPNNLSPNQTQKLAAKKNSKKINITVQDETMENVLSLIEKEVGVNIILMKSLYSPKITLSLSQVPWLEALKFIEFQYKYHLEQISPNIYKMEVAPLVSIEFQNASVPKVINTIATVTSRNVIYPQEFGGRVNLRLKDVTWNEALETIVRVSSPDYGTFLQNPSLIRISKKEKKPPSSTTQKTPLFLKQELPMVSLNLSEKSLIEVLAQLEKQTNWKIVHEIKTQNKISLQLDNVSLLDALKYIASQFDCRISQVEKKTLRLTQSIRFDLNFFEADLNKVVHMIASAEGINIICPDNLKGKVTIDLRDVLLEEALKEIVFDFGYRVIKEKNIYRIVNS